MSAAKSKQKCAVPKTVVIVDDHPLLRLGLTALIDSDPGLVVCGEAASVGAALTVVRERQPDLVTVDLMLAPGDGLDLVKELKKGYPDTPCLVLSMHDESVYSERALRAGASGYVTKQQLDGTVLDAMHHVIGGGTYMSKTLEARLAKKFISGRKLDSDSPLDALSDRELQVFRLVGEGRSTRQVAESLSLSVKTIESHFEHIKQKLTVTSSVELVHRACEWVNSRG